MLNLEWLKLGEIFMNLMLRGLKIMEETIIKGLKVALNGVV